MNAKKLNMYFAPHQTCNMNCLYCYVPEQSRKQKKAEDNEIISSLREFIAKLEREDYQIGNFCFHGAEPTLMSAEALGRAASLVRAHWTRTNCSNKAPAIQTNGLNLSEIYLNNLKKSLPPDGLLRIGFSIDPPKQVHDKYRDNSFDKVEANLYKAMDMGFPISILSVVSPETLDNLNEFGKWMKKMLKLKKENNNPYKVKIKFATGQYGLNDDHIKIIAKYLIDNDLLELVQILSPEYCLQNGNNCKWFEFDIYGGTFSCNKSFAPEKSFADWREESFENIIEKREKLFIYEKTHEECSICPYEAYCSSGCPIDRFKEGEMAGKAHECSLIKMAYEYSLEKGNIFDL